LHWELFTSFTLVSINLTLYAGFIQLASGLSVGLGGLAAGIAVGIVGDAGVRAVAQQPRVFVSLNNEVSDVQGWYDSYLDFCRSLGFVWADW
jgi:F0F1-type ATP synthase membrane subunit c/vacuolar-type H+-ATPase subunit K